MGVKRTFLFLLIVLFSSFYIYSEESLSNGFSDKTGTGAVRRFVREKQDQELLKEVELADFSIEDLFSSVRFLRKQYWEIKSNKLKRQKLSRSFMRASTGYDKLEDEIKILELEKKEAKALGNVMEVDGKVLSLDMCIMKRNAIKKKTISCIVQWLENESATFDLCEAFYQGKVKLKKARAMLNDDALNKTDLFLLEELDNEASVFDSGEPAFVLKLESNRDSSCLVYLNRRVKATAFVDSDFPTIAVSKSFAIKNGFLSLLNTGVIDLSEYGHFQISGEPAFFDTIQIGDIVLENVFGVICDDSLISGSDVVFGLPLLGAYAVRKENTGNYVCFKIV